MLYFRPAAIALFTFLFTVSVMVEPASAVDSTSVVLEWDLSPDSGILGYKVYRTEISNSFSSPPLNGSTLVTGSIFTDSTGQAGKTYYYAVTAVSNTGLESPRSNVVQTTIVVPAPAPLPPPLNLAPAVSAGADRTITLPASASLTATATDDGLPNGQLTYRWSQVQGSPVTFTAPLSAATQVSFPAAGAYTLRVTVTDGQLSSTDDVVINVQPAANRAPTVSAGADKTITLPASASLTATATDDGLPNAQLSYNWTLIQGSGATFTSPQSATTQVSFPAAGAYTLRATVTDGQLTATDDVVVNVQPAANRAPTVSAGADKTITLPASASLTATATDDGLPNAQLSYNWSLIQGSGATFTSPLSAATQVSFPAAGAYTLRATVTDGQLTATDDVVINVQPAANRAPTVSAGSDKTITLPASASLTAIASDDGLPGSPLTYQWSVLQGTGVTIQSPRTATTQVSFAGAGTFALRVLVSDGQLSASDDVVVVASSAQRKTKGKKVGQAGGTGSTPVTSNVTVTATDTAASMTATSDAAAPAGEDQADTDFLLLAPQATSAPSLEIAIMEYRHTSMRLSDAVFKSMTPIRNGRIYALMQESTNTGIAIANPNPEPVVINFNFADAAGASIYTSQLSLPSGGKSSTFIDESPLRPQSATDLSRIRSFSFSASAPVAAAAVRILTNERKDFLMTSIPIADLDQVEPSLTFPFYADGGGWQSEIQLVNTTGSSLYGTVQLFPSLRGSGADFVYAIPPHAAVALQTPGLAGEATTGWVQVVPEADTPSPAGSLILSNKTNGVTTSMGTVVSTPASSFYHVYVETSGQGEPGSVQTTLTLANPTSRPASVSLEVLTMNWQSTEHRATVTIGAHDKVTMTTNQIPGMENVTPFKGIVRIGGDPVTAAGFLARYSDYGQVLVTSLPAIGISMGPSASERRFLFIAEGGSFFMDLKDVNSLGHLSDALD